VGGVRIDLQFVKLGRKGEGINEGGGREEKCNNWGLFKGASDGPLSAGTKTPLSGVRAEGGLKNRVMGGETCQSYCTTGCPDVKKQKDGMGKRGKGNVREMGRQGKEKESSQPTTGGNA